MIDSAWPAQKPKSTHYIGDLGQISNQKLVDFFCEKKEEEEIVQNDIILII
jgi:hypothetical protein